MYDKAQMNLGEYDDEECSDEEDESELDSNYDASPQTNGKSNKKK